MIRRTSARVTIAVASALLFATPLVSKVQPGWADDSSITPTTVTAVETDNSQSSPSAEATAPIVTVQS